MESFTLAELQNLVQRGQNVGLVVPQGLGSLDGKVSYLTAMGGAWRPWAQMQESEVKVGACGSFYLIALFPYDLEKQSQELKMEKGIWGLQW